MKLSIILPIFNKFNFTKSCLNDLAKLPNDHEIIVIDNASTDETNSEIGYLFDSLRNKYPNGCKLNYYKNDENTFHSKACNQGFKKSKGENILFLNNDIRIKANYSNWTDKLIKLCETINGLMGPTMGQLDGNLNFVKEANENLSGNSYLSGWCIAANRKTWNLLDIDGSGQIWNEKYPFYFNDTDLSFRAHKKAISLNVITPFEIVHFGKVSAQQINIHKLYSDGRKVFLQDWNKQNSKR